MGSSERTAERQPASLARLRRLVCGAATVGLLVSGLYMLPNADAGGETRSMTLYSVNTKEKLTTTYMVNGKHVPSELAKINHLLRDWRRNAVTKIDTRTIDLMWELHADLGSRAPIHIISGYRSAETNSMLKSIGRNVARRSMHIQGKAIDLYFPDVPTERLRNSALVREVGGVGFYPRSGASGFVHLDSGRVRHWPGISSSKLAQIRRDYRKTVGARLGGDRAVQVASAEQPSQGDESYPTPMPRPRPIEVLMMAAAQTVVQPSVPQPVLARTALAQASVAEAPVVQPVSAPAPVHNFAEGATRVAGKPRIEPKVDLALAQMTIQPIAAPAPTNNFADRASPVRDTLATELGPDHEVDRVVGQVIEIPQQKVKTEVDFLTALRDSFAQGAEDLLSWPVKLISEAENLIWRESPEQRLAAAAPEEPENPFPPISVEDAAELEVIIAALRSRAEYDAQSAEELPSAKGDRLSLIRARKGDLILTAPIPRYSAAMAATPAVAVDKVAVQTFKKLLQATE